MSDPSFSHLTLHELRRRILTAQTARDYVLALAEWFRRTEHVSEQTAKEATRGAS